MTGHRGVTLVELIVVIVLLGVVAAVGAVALRRAQPLTVADAAVGHALLARDSAMRSGRVVTITVRVGEQESSVTAFPDGRVLSDADLGIDPLSGRASHASR